MSPRHSAEAEEAMATAAAGKGDWYRASPRYMDAASLWKAIGVLERDAEAYRRAARCWRAAAAAQDRLADEADAKAETLEGVHSGSRTNRSEVPS